MWYSYYKQLYLNLDQVAKGLSRRKWSPATTGPAGPSMTTKFAVDGPARPVVGGPSVV